MALWHHRTQQTNLLLLISRFRITVDRRKKMLYGKKKLMKVIKSAIYLYLGGYKVFVQSFEYNLGLTYSLQRSHASVLFSVVLINCAAVY